MNLLFVYKNSNKIVKSEVELELKLHEVRFKKAFFPVHIGKIREQFQSFSAYIIPDSTPEIFLKYDSCDVKLSHHGLLKVNGKTKEKVLEVAEYFEKIIKENKIIFEEVKLNSLF